MARNSQTRRLTVVNLPHEPIKRIRDAVFRTLGLTIAKLIADAVGDAIDGMEEANTS